MSFGYGESEKVWVWIELRKGSTEWFGLGTGRNKKLEDALNLGRVY